MSVRPIPYNNFFVSNRNRSTSPASADRSHFLRGDCRERLPKLSPSTFSIVRLSWLLIAELQVSKGTSMRGSLILIVIILGLCCKTKVACEAVTEVEYSKHWDVGDIPLMEI